MASDDKTVFDPGATAPESDKTVLESDATISDDGTTMLEAALSDAAGQAGENIASAAIQKGDTILDTYRVESDAIEGGMGSVWRVHHTGWNVDLAMKRPQPKCFSSEKSKADFIHECEAWINLGLHPNIVSCYYVREISGTPSIFSEWMDGGSLEGAIHKETLYAGAEAEQTERLLDLAIQFARGLHYAHEAGLIHQDVKPDNVLLTKEGEAKVADFGLARARAALTALEGDVTMRDAADGGKTMLSPSGGYTPAYCSMEQMDGKALTRRTDIYSWAVSVMEMYVGARPWANGVVAGLSCSGYFERTRVPMPEALKALLAQCLDSEPENRPHDFAEIEAKLHEIYRAETGNTYPRLAPKAAADTADSLNNRALSFLDLGRPDEAERCWERALSINGEHAAAKANSSLFQWRTGRMDDILLFHSLEQTAFEAQSRAGDFAEQVRRECGEIRSKRCAFGKAYVGAWDAAVSPDGRTLVTSPWSQKAIVWALPSMEKRLEIEVSNAQALAFSGDGLKIYADTGNKDSGCFMIADAQTGKRIAAVPYEGHVGEHLCVTPDGEQVLGIGGQVLRFYNGRTGRVERSIAFDSSTDMIMLPDSMEIIVAQGHEARRIDLASGEVLTTYSGHSDTVSTLALSPDATKLLSGSWDGTARLWDLESGSFIKALTQGSGWVTSVCYAADGGGFAVGDQNGCIKIYSSPCGNCARTLVTDDYWVERLLPVAANQFVAVESNAELMLVEAPPMGGPVPMRLSRIASFRQTDAYVRQYRALIREAQEALADGRPDQALAAVDKAFRGAYQDENELIELNARIGGFCSQLKPRAARLRAVFEVADIEFCKRRKLDVVARTDGSRAYATGWCDPESYVSEIVRMDVDTMRIGPFCGDTLCRPDGRLNLSPDGGFLTVLSSQKAELFNAREEFYCGIVSEARCKVTCACSNGNGDVVIVDGHLPRLLKQRNVYQDSFPLECPEGYGDARYAAFSPEERSVFVLYKSAALRFDTVTLAHTETYRCPDDCRCMDISSDGVFLAVGMETGELRVFDIRDASVVYEQNAGARINRISFGAQSDQIWCALENGAVNMYGISKSAPTFQITRGMLNNPASSVAVLGGGRFALITDDIGRLCVWELVWEYAFPGFADWAEDARPYLTMFLESRRGWTDEDFQELIARLRSHGYGWLNEEGVRAKLLEMKPGKKSGLGGLFKRRG